MAINQAIIRIRRGLKDELQIDKLLPGELAMATDAPIMWFCWSPGEVEQVPTSENITEVIEEIIQKYLEDNPVTGVSEIYMRVSGGYIQYSSDNKKWNNVIAISEITGSKGDPGLNGVGIVAISQASGNPNGGRNTLKITTSDGEVREFYTYNGTNGKDGDRGVPGPAGVGIESVIPTKVSTADNGTSEITVTLTNGNTSKFNVKNGSKGSTGATGAAGSAGKDGVSASHSWNGTVLTVTSASGTSSADLKGDKGDPGSDATVPDWAKASTKPTYTKTEVGLGNVDNVKQYSASNPPPYPVTSVNGMTGVVNLTPVTIGAVSAGKQITVIGIDESGTEHTWTFYGVEQGLFPEPE